MDEQIDDLLFLMTNSISNHLEQITKIWSGMHRPDWSLTILAELEWLKEKQEPIFLEAARALQKLAQKEWDREGHKILSKDTNLKGGIRLYKMGQQPGGRLTAQPRRANPGDGPGIHRAGYSIERPE
jgi:hypothetical protein